MERSLFRTAGGLCVAFGLLLAGCASPLGAHLEERRASAEAEIVAQGLAGHPAIAAAQGELEAALAREDAEVAIDGLELRAALVHEGRDEKAQALARLPLRNPLELREQKRARRAESEVALARLEEATLAQRVAGCLPSLETLVRSREEEIYEAYESRYRALLEWNDELESAGLIDEVGARRFELASQVKLTTRDPSGAPAPLPLAGSQHVLDVLPAVSANASLLRAEPAVLRGELMRNQPALGVHRANRKRFEALARRETMKRLPAPRFVDLGFEPVAFPGDDRQVEARIAFEIPFGRAASATARHYEALARAERSGERALVDVRMREAAFAVGEINAFRARAEHWIALSALADDSEAIADRWWRERLAGPSDISSLLDSVYAARVAVLEARLRAGRAGCDVVAATGLSVAEWPL